MPGPEELREGIVLWLLLVISISFHEFAHAKAADKLGDYTPRSQGRVTISPLAHIDLLGTVILPLVMILFNPGFAIFGWGKPVMFNPHNFTKPVRDELITTAAGPISNLVLCLIAAIVGGLLLRFVPAESIVPAVQLFSQFIFLNVLLAVFNMVPVPPLDGSHFLRFAIGMKEETYMKLSQFGFIIILLLINFPPFTALLRFAMGVVAAPFFALLQALSGA